MCPYRQERSLSAARVQVDASQSSVELLIATSTASNETAQAEDSLRAAGRRRQAAAPGLPGHSLSAMSSTAPANLDEARELWQPRNSRERMLSASVLAFRSMTFGLYAFKR